MKPGDLRRFNDTLGGDGYVIATYLAFAGCTFVVLEVNHNHAEARGGSVKLLIDGRVDEGWSRLWVLENSEVISETR